MKRFHLHLVSDASGETVLGVARVCLLQFKDIEAIEHISSLVRSRTDVEKTLAGIAANPGICLYTLVDARIRDLLEEGCRSLGVPCVPVLDPILGTIADHLDVPIQGKPGRHHGMNSEYFGRIDAMHFVLSHDDGQSSHDLDDADVIVLGVSRTSKTPICIYLANRGVKAANIPVVPGCPLPGELFRATHPLVVGLTKDAKMLIQIRRNRLRQLGEDEDTDYTDPEEVTREVTEARRLFSQYDWPTIDVTRRSIEETAAAILQLHVEHKRRLS